MSTLDRNWARRLTNPRLADDLRKIAGNVRWTSPDERAVRLCEAADRLDEPAPTPQILVTLADGRQIALMHGTVHVRSSVGDSWSLPLDASLRPHEPGTWYVGEW